MSASCPRLLSRQSTHAFLLHHLRDSSGLKRKHCRLAEQSVPLTSSAMKFKPSRLSDQSPSAPSAKPHAVGLHAVAGEDKLAPLLALAGVSQSVGGIDKRPAAAASAGAGVDQGGERQAPLVGLKRRKSSLPTAAAGSGGIDSLHGSQGIRPMRLRKVAATPTEHRGRKHCYETTTRGGRPSAITFKMALVARLRLLSPAVDAKRPKYAEVAAIGRALAAERGWSILRGVRTLTFGRDWVRDFLDKFFGDVGDAAEPPVKRSRGE